MSNYTQMILTTDQKILEEIEEIIENNFYSCEQDFILEAIREKISKQRGS